MTRFDEDLASLTSGMVEMTGLAATAISRASFALLNGDLEMAESVIADDERMDSWQWSLDDQIVVMMTKHGALGRDLRRLVVRAARHRGPRADGRPGAAPRAGHPR